MTEHYLYPAAQDDLYPSCLDQVPIYEWIFFDPQIKIRRNGAICPICSAIMDNPCVQFYTFDYCPIYLLVCPLCSYEDSIS